MALNNRYDFVMLFDVENGNPNGDPDAGNAPRIDAESGLGYITDVCLKRKIRNYVELVKDGEAGFAILVKADRSLNAKFEEAYDANNLKKGQKGKNSDDVRVARDYMCRNYYDVRMFGAVMSTGDNPCGIVRGPVQINFARSLSPINIQDVTITRQARTTDDRMETGTTEMGKRASFPMPSTVRKDMFLRRSPTGQPIFPRKTWSFSGTRSSICLRRITAPPEERCA